MARGILTIGDERPGSSDEKVTQVIVLALAMNPGTFNSGLSEKGASSIVNEVPSAPIVSKGEDLQKESALVKGSVANAIMRIAQREKDRAQSDSPAIFLWCSSPPDGPAHFHHVTLSEDDEDSLLLITRARHGFGPLADKVVYGLIGNRLIMCYMEAEHTLSPHPVLDTDKANADSKMDQAFQTARDIWRTSVQTLRQIEFRSWANKQSLYPIIKARWRDYFRSVLKPCDKTTFATSHWTRVVQDARDVLCEGPNEFSGQLQGWWNDVNSQIVNLWCHQFLEGEKPDFKLAFTPDYFTPKWGQAKFTCSWNDLRTRRKHLLSYICSRLRSPSSPNTPGVDAPFEIQSCDPFGEKRSNPEDAERNPVMCADVPRNTGEKWLKIARTSPRESPDISDATLAGNRAGAYSRTLVFPAHKFDAAFNLHLSDEDIRNLPGFIKILEWQKKYVNCECPCDRPDVF